MADDFFVVTNSQALATILAWAAVLVIISLLTLIIYRKHVVPSAGEWIAGICAALALAIAGAMTATLPLISLGSIDVELFRVGLSLFRGIGTALFLALLLKEMGWAPPGIRRFLS